MAYEVSQKFLVNAFSFGFVHEAEIEISSLKKWKKKSNKNWICLPCSIIVFQKEKMRNENTSIIITTTEK